MPTSKRKNVSRSGKGASARLAPKQVAAPGPAFLSIGATRIVLIGATIVCLLPFIGKSFNIDDPLFVWTGKQIVHHPLNPYGFSLVWYESEMPMSEVTKNPPLASYYAALIGSWTNWSEVPLHLAFLLPAVVVVLATYELARDLTSRPLLAASLTLAAPAFLVSSTSVMCDVPMLALWMVCLLVWRKGLSSGRGLYLTVGALLIAACALTKYFGACLIPLLFLYSIFKQRRLGIWALYFLLPVAVLAGYQLWTQDLYGRGLLLDAAQYAQVARSEQAPSMFGGFLVGLSFIGGCMLSILLMAPLLFRKLWIAAGAALAVPCAMLLAWNVVGEFAKASDRNWLCVTLAVFILGGIFALALTAVDLWRRRDAEAAFLSAWVLGTFVFAAILNWTVNARSILPLVPAIAILIARGMDDLQTRRPHPPWVIALPVAVSLAISLWLASADTALANSTREAASLVRSRVQSEQQSIFFSGHWGFQYYMEALGARPFDALKPEMTRNDVLVQPGNNSNTFSIPPAVVSFTEPIEIDVNQWITSARPGMGAGFYSSVFGPLPFALGRVPPERYMIYHFKAAPPPP